jgi:hypothetical protein
VLLYRERTSPPLLHSTNLRLLRYSENLDVNGAGVTQIILEGQWSRSEYFRAIRLGQNWWPESLVAVCLAVVALTTRPHLVWAITGGVIIIGMIAVSFWAIPNKFWNKGVGTQEPRRTIINDDGLRTKSSSLEIFLEWKRFSRSRESREFYFLHLKGSMFSTPIRKASFLNGDDEAIFRTLLRAHTVASLTPNVLFDPDISDTPST